SETTVAESDVAAQNSAVASDAELSKRPPTAVGAMPARAVAHEQTTVLAVLTALSLSHFLNDVMQSLLPAVYPLLKENYALTFFQIGLITFVFQVTASLLQPLVGLYTDRRPWAYSLVLSA